MMRKLFWSIPFLISIAVGFLLWDVDGFDVGQVLGAWGVIAVMMLLYGTFLFGLPAYESDARKDRGHSR